MVNNEFVSDFGLEVKYAPLGRSDGQGNSVIDGYASLFGVPDQNGDVVEKGAFQASLKKLKDAGRSVKLLWQHDPAQPIGVWDKVYEDDIGLKVKGRLITEVAKGAEGAALMAAGAIDGLSIGYKTIRSEKEGAGRRLIELDPDARAILERAGGLLPAKIDPRRSGRHYLKQDLPFDVATFDARLRARHGPLIAEYGLDEAAPGGG